MQTLGVQSRRYAGWIIAILAVVAVLAIVSPTTQAGAEPSAKADAPTPRSSDAASAESPPSSSKAQQNVPAHSLLLASGAAPAGGSDNDDPKDSKGDQAPSDPTAYGLWTVVPALVAIILAIFTRQVVPALVVGVLAGAYMMVPYLATGSPYAGQHTVVGGFRLAMEHYVIETIVDPSDGYGHVKIIVFTLVIGFMVGVLGRNGGTAGLVRIVAGESQSRRRGALATWFAGLVVFFDDYANSMIVGPTMRSVFDQLKMSRAKLAYIVDSTAAPVASMAIIGTWIGAEVGFIQDGINAAVVHGVPAMLDDGAGGAVKGMQVFIGSLPYRFYPILALFMVFLICLTGRDFGPMRRSESKALADQDDHPYDAGPVYGSVDGVTPSWWLGLFPILVLVGGTLAVLAATGMQSVADAGTPQEASLTERAYAILAGADSYLSIFYGAILASFVALILTMIARACSVRDAADAGLDGMARMFPAIVILVLAWAISSVEQDLMLGEVVRQRLQAAEFPIEWMPLAIFVSAAGISFATGTSWGTMGLLCPVTVTVMVGLASGLDIEPERASNLLHAAVGSVLAGAIFGDHCSPISDTTVLSSVACGCRHEEHVWTQLPYAVVTAVAAMALGDVVCSVYDQPWYLGIAGGAAFLVLVVLIVGRRPVQPEGLDLMSVAMR